MDKPDAEPPAIYQKFGKPVKAGQLPDNYKQRKRNKDFAICETITLPAGNAYRQTCSKHDIAKLAMPVTFFLQHIHTSQNPFPGAGHSTFLAAGELLFSFIL